MKIINIYYSFLLSVMFLSCSNEQRQKIEVTNNGIQILTIDSCQYVWCKEGYGAGLTHKGNCKFCIERNKN